MTNQTDQVEKSNLEEADSILKSILYDKHHIKVLRPARVKDGVMKFNASKRRRFLKKFKKYAGDISYSDFIPATSSGTSIIEDLVLFAQNYNPDEESVSTYINTHGCYSLGDFFKYIKRLPFYSIIDEEIKKIQSTADDFNQARLQIAKYILTTDKLNIDRLPMALISICRDVDDAVTPLEQHINLHAAIADRFDHSSLTFAVPQKFKQDFRKFLGQDNLRAKNLEINTTIQDPNSNVYCLNDQNLVATTSNGKKLRIPSGHGSLLQNLNEVDASVVHLSSIQNILKKINLKAYVKHKKVMIGYLMYVVDQVHKYLEKLENGELSKKEKKKLGKFLKRYFSLDFNVALKQSDEGTLSTIYHLLNAPVRIAAVVPMKDAAGDFPFWALNSRNIETLQIINDSQIDTRDEFQKAALASSTQYSFASIFLFKNDYKGTPFDLEDYGDMGANTIAEKVVNGQKVKYVEQSGLWNSKMKDHLTVFVQADEKVFNPINHITDLLPKKNLKRRRRISR